MSTYLDAFIRAKHRTQAYSLTLPEIETDESKRYITQEFLDEFPHLVLKNTRIRQLSDLSAQCLAVNLILREIIAARLECPVYYTIGWINDGTEKGLFKFDDPLIEAALSGKMTMAGEVNIHAWLTLPSMEVIDPTISTTIALANKIDDGLGKVFAGRADSTKDFSFEPMLIGEDLLRRSGGLVDLEIWASE